MTPGGSSSPRRIFSFFSSKRLRITSTWRSVRSSRSRRSSSRRESSVAIFSRTIVSYGISCRISWVRSVPFLNSRPRHRLVRHLLQDLLREMGALLEQPLAAVLVEEIRAQLLAAQHDDHPLLDLLVEDADLVLEVLLHHVELFLLDRFRPVILFDALAGEDLDADDDAFDARRADQAGVTDVAGLLAEDRAQQLLFRRQLRLTLRRD